MLFRSQRLLELPTVATDDVLLRLGRAAKLAGDTARASAAFQRAYYEFPMGDTAVEAATEPSRSMKVIIMFFMVALTSAMPVFSWPCL